MARKKIKSRTTEVAPSIPMQSKHEKMLSEMHSALYTLGDRIRKPIPRDGEKLLPKSLRTFPEGPQTITAKKAIETFHQHMKEGMKENEEKD